MSSSSSSSSSDDQKKYDRCVSKGRELLNSMSTKTAESPWNDDPTKTFLQYGYTIARKLGELPTDHESQKQLYTDLGIELSTDRWATMSVDHENKYTIGKVEYTPTAVWFKIHMNAQDGVLRAVSSRGMDLMIASWKQGNLPTPKSPDHMLQSWSDCAYLMWRYECEERKISVSNIKYFFQEKVTNDTTTKLLDNILAKNKKTKYSLGKWPGITIEPESDGDFKALLGSPNGYGPAYFLTQHQASLGRKKIKAVQIWKNGNHIDMLFRVAPA
ncbi:MAG: hypothetical protein M1822_007028 [Bathelium mastoideum]|nr:MAG: hypothetical protein M1822_007028 [Bathelium mastoideum]